MTIRERILDYLRNHPEGVDDDALTAALGLSQRQTANQYCRRLESERLVERRRVAGKIRNFLVGDVSGPAYSQRPVARSAKASIGRITLGRPWYWEGNVQTVVVSYLATNGYKIVRVADTVSREAGKDVIAIAPSGQKLWVNVKGYPEMTERTNAATQARHWFAGAIYDLIVWRGEDPHSALVLALPADFSTYRNMAQRIAWVLPVINASIFWVGENGVVKVQKPQ